MKKNRLHIFKLFIVILTGCLSVFSSLYSFAGNVQPLVKTLEGKNGQLKVDSLVYLTDSIYNGANYQGKFTTPYKIINKVSFSIDEFSTSYIPEDFSASVKVRISSEFIGQSGTSVTDTVLQVNFISKGKYTQEHAFYFRDGHTVEVKILEINTEASWDVWKLLRITNELQSYPVFVFDCDEDKIEEIFSETLSPDTEEDEIEVSWGKILAADEYDLEWSFIDSAALASGRYGNASNPDRNKVFSNNSTRVSIKGNTYSIPLIYDNKGSLFFRARPVQIKPDGTRLSALWSNSSTSLGRFEYDGHQKNLNWQATTSFAEDGKRKVVVQYFDGSLRARQIVTKDNTNNTTIVSETFYDFQGRPVVQVLPAPGLSNIIKYSQGFNTNNSLNQPYSPYDFDLMQEEELYSGTSAKSMNNSSGAANYYSPENPLSATGKHSFIPDANGFPFTETEYTRDNTGRISRQSGVGPDFKLGSGHETKYYYGTVFQEELDALFGTEAGYASHYFKTMVRDANGQHSVSYTDMHGRTVATALAGLPEAKLDLLPSFDSLTVTKNLSDPESTVINGLVMESKKSLLVTLGGEHVFNYNLSPDSLIVEGCDANLLCFDCLYDLRITITDDSNNEKLGGKAFDTLISNFRIDSISLVPGNGVKGFNVNFSLNLPIGSYDITKQLSVSETALNYYRDSAVLNALVCKTLDDFIEEQRAVYALQQDCNISCEECLLDVSDYETFRGAFLLNAGISSTDSAYYASSIQKAYQEAIENCHLICETVTDAHSVRKAMLEDLMAPSGQYADINNLHEYSIFYETETSLAKYKLVSNYKDENGKPEKVYDEAAGEWLAPEKLSFRAFHAKFKPSWAEALLPYHPEYCKLQVYESPVVTDALEWLIDFEKTASFSEALLKGYLNPTNNTGFPFNRYNAWVGNHPGPDPLASLPAQKSALEVELLRPMNNYVNSTGISIWALVNFAVNCEGNSPACFSKYIDDNNAFDTTEMCTADLDMAWNMFKELYLNSRTDILNKYINTQCSSSPYNTNDLIEEGFFVHFGPHSELFSANDFNIPDSPSEYDDFENEHSGSLQPYFQSTCESYVSQWMSRLEGCGYTEYQQSVIAARLVQVCIEGSDNDHPLGSSSVKPSSTYTYRSFEEVIREFNAENSIVTDESCSPYAIDFPQPYEKQAGLFEKLIISKPDDCECETIGNFYESYTVEQEVFNSFSEFMQSRYNTNISNNDLYTLLTACNYFGGNENPDCRFLETPVHLPVVFNCNSSGVCIDCHEFNELMEEYTILYPGKLPVLTEDIADTVQARKNTFFSSFMNSRLGFNKSAAEYLAFLNGCAIDINIPSCDSLRNLVDTFNYTLNPLKLTVAQQSNYLPEGQTYITNRSLIVDSGYVRFPDLVRDTMNGAGWVYTQLAGLGKLCMDEGFIFEGRFKFLKNVLPDNSDVLYHTSASSGFVLFRRTTVGTPGLYLGRINGRDINGDLKDFYTGSVLLDTDPDIIFKQWNNFKFKVTQDTFYFYYNNALIQSVATEGRPLGTHNGLTTAFYSHHGAMDYLKLYDAEGDLKYFEDFETGKAAFADYSFVCTPPAPNCDAAFVNFYNNQHGTSYTYAQLQEIYASCGQVLRVCDNNFNTLSDTLQALLEEGKCRYNSLNDSLVNTQQCGTSLWSFQGNHPVTGSYNINEVSHPQLIAGGIVKMPFEPDGISYGSLNFTSQRNFCINNEFAFEARIRNPITLDTNGIPTLAGDISFRIDNRSDNNPGYNDEDFLFALYQNASPGYYQLRGTRTYHPALGNQRFDDWRVLRYAANPLAFEIFLDDTLVLSVPRDGQSSISVIGTARMIARYARTYEIDWFKLYVENDSLIFHEDFNDVYNLSKPVPGHYCPIEPCEVFFKNFVNSRLGKSYTYEQVDSLYQANGLNLNICPGPLTLCGNPEPVFPQVDVNDIDNCSDSSLFIYSAAIEYYKVYKDSIINDFTDRYVEKCLEAYKYESFTVTGPASEYHYTLYYYDQAGNLAKTVPPAGVRLNRNSQWLQEVREARKTGNYKTPDHELVTNYRYNTLNQVVAQHSPDGGKSSFWYDRLGRLVLSQNASQFAVSSTEEGRLFSYTKYDALGRIREVGQVKNAQSTVAVNQVLTQNPAALQSWFEELDDYRGQVTGTIYDLPYEPFVLQYSNLLLVQRNLRNRVSYVTYSDTAASSYNTASFYTYDIHGNVDTLLLDYGQSIGAFANIMNKNANRFKKIAYNYDLISGKVNLVAYQHGRADRFYHRYSYDAENRLVKAETSTDSLRWEQDAGYQYYLHGPLARTVLGHRQVQGFDYAYTLQGWLKGVNSTAISAEQDMGGDGLPGGLNQYVAKDAFGFNLNYYTGDYSAINENKLPFPGHMAFMAPLEHRQLYNGNISSMAVHNSALDADNLAGGQLLLYNYRYDQLNRITGMEAYNGFDKINNHWQGLAQLNIFKESVAYDANGNILKYLRHGHRSPFVMDSLSYHYYPGTNRLNHVTDQVAAASFGNGQNDVADIDNQNADNYHYDEIGNLVNDLAEGIDKITWTVYGKIASIEKANGTNIFYTYDPSGNRISKLVQRSSGDKNYTWYVRDAQGNVMAAYTAKGEEEDLADFNLKLSEQHLYGSSRLGILAEEIDVDNNNEGPEEVEEEFAITYARGYKQYELSNHLGNVLATVSDKKSGIDSDDDEEIDYFEPEIITASDYYPFGMLMPGRGGSLINGQWQESGPAVLANLVVDSRTANLPDEYIALESIEFLPGFESGSADEFVAYITTSGGGGSEGTDGLYRYGFNGKENDNETRTQDYGMRIYNPGLGRFLSVDPLHASYPWYSPYHFGGNQPIVAIDLDGKEPMWGPGNFIWEKWMEWKYGDPTGAKSLYNGAVLKTTVESRQMDYHNEKVPIEVQEKWDRHNNLKADAEIVSGTSNIIQFNIKTSFEVTSSVVPVSEGVMIVFNVLKPLNKAKTAFTLKRATNFGNNGLKLSPPVETPVINVSLQSIDATKGVTNGLSKTVSSQKQLRHLVGTAENAKNGGGFMNSVADAQSVLDAVHSGKATFLGTNKAGFPVYRFNGVTGTNVNAGAGITNQSSNVFIIKGTTSPSVVPTNPFWKP